MSKLCYCIGNVTIKLQIIVESIVTTKLVHIEYTSRSMFTYNITDFKTKIFISFTRTNPMLWSWLGFEELAYWYKCYVYTTGTGLEGNILAMVISSVWRSRQPTQNKVGQRFVLEATWGDRWSGKAAVVESPPRTCLASRACFYATAAPSPWPTVYDRFFCSKEVTSGRCQVLNKFW